MLPAAFRRALSAMLLACGLNAAAAPITATHFGGADYVSVIAVCGRLGLKYAGSVDGRSLTLRNALHTGSLTAEHREMILDGVRVLLGDIAVARGGQFYVSFADYEHRLRPLFRPDLAVPLPRRPRIIVLDPGHGGVDPGAENKRFHAQEKTFTLDVALRLRPLLLAQGWKVAMTRVRDAPFTNDKARDLEMRAGFAAQWGADVFLSIHFDAAPGDSTRGSEIFSFDPVGQRSSDAWGKRILEPPLTQPSPGNRFDDWNALLAHTLYRRLPSSLATYDHGEKLGNWSVLRNAPCPAVLVEPVFLSNEAEVQRLETPAFRQQIAETLAAGLKDYAALLDSLLPRPPPPPAPPAPAAAK